MSEYRAIWHWEFRLICVCKLRYVVMVLWGGGAWCLLKIICTNSINICDAQCNYWVFIPVHYVSVCDVSIQTEAPIVRQWQIGVLKDLCPVWWNKIWTQAIIQSQCMQLGPLSCFRSMALYFWSILSYSLKGLRITSFSVLIYCNKNIHLVRSIFGHFRGSFTLAGKLKKNIQSYVKH